MIKLAPIFKIRVVYKSGYHHDFEVTKFTWNGNSCSWESVSDKNKPIVLNIDLIESVWQVGVRHTLKFGK